MYDLDLQSTNKGQKQEREISRDKRAIEAHGIATNM